MVKPRSAMFIQVASRAALQFLLCFNQIALVRLDSVLSIFLPRASNEVQSSNCIDYWSTSLVKVEPFATDQKLKFLKLFYLNIKNPSFYWYLGLLNPEPNRANAPTERLTIKHWLK